MDKKKIVLLTTEPESFVQEKFTESAEKLGFELAVINPDECYIFLSTETYFANKGTKFDSADACIPRLSETHLDYKVAIMKHLEKIGVKVLNTGASMRTASNKIETQIILNNEGIKTPKTALFINEEQLDKALDSIGGKFPVIVKTIFGTHGVGVMRADSLASLRSICQQLVKTGVEFMLQEYQYFPEKLILIDDLLINLKSVQLLSKKLNIDFQGFHYTAEKMLALPDLDPKLEQLRFSILKQQHLWLSYKELEQYS